MLKKVVISLIICSSLFVSSYGHANPFLLRLFSLGGKTLDLGLKIPPVINALEQMKERRNSQEYAGQFQYNQGAVSLTPNAISNYHQGETLRHQAWAFAKNGQHQQAILVYERALEQDANNSKTWHGYGWSLSQNGRYDRANNAFSIAIHLGNYDKEDESWRYLGWNYERQGYIEEAEYCYRIAVMLNPQNDAATHALASISKLKIRRSNSTSTTTTAKNGLMFRMQPITSAKVISKIPNGTVVKLIEYRGNSTTIQGTQGRWAMIDYNGRTGYVFGGYLSTNTNRYSTLPTQNALISAPQPTVSIAPNRTEAYTVQAGVFQSETNAAKLLKKLKATDQNLKISRRQAGNEFRYHVELGSFNSKELATQAKTSMLELNPDQQFLVKHYK